MDPSICGVKLRRSNQVDGETQPPGFEATAGEFDCRPQVLERPRPAQPLLAFATAALLLFPRPGGGPRDLLFMGAPQSSEITAVGCGAVSPQVFLVLKK